MTWRETQPSEYIRYDVARNYLHDACQYMGGDGGLDIKCRFDHENTTTVPQWIPCSERLPEESDDYLCSYGMLTGHFVGIDIYEAEKKEFGFYSDDEQGNEVWHPVKNVVAWMPLPEPWRAES